MAWNASRIGMSLGGWPSSAGDSSSRAKRFTRRFTPIVAPIRYIDSQLGTPTLTHGLLRHPYRRQFTPCRPVTTLRRRRPLPLPLVRSVFAVAVAFAAEAHLDDHPVDPRLASPDGSVLGVVGG